MKKAVRELIAKAVPRVHDKFMELYVIDSEKKYGGTYGVNGYNNIILIGRARGCAEYELITDWSDAIHIFEGSVNIDINSRNGIVRLWSDSGFKIDGAAYSSVIINNRWGI